MKRSLTVFLALFFVSTAASAESARVIAVQGKVTRADGGAEKPLAVGDVLLPGHAVSTGNGAFLDVAYDAAYDNVTRFEGGTRARLEEPDRILLENGAVFASLKRLPKDSSFTVTTPVSTASVRGSEFRVLSSRGEKAAVQNLSESPVTFGGRVGDPVTLKAFEKSAVENDVSAAASPVPMTEAEKRVARSILADIEAKIQSTPKKAFERAEKFRRVAKDADSAHEAETKFEELGEES